MYVDILVCTKHNFPIYWQKFKHIQIIFLAVVRYHLKRSQIAQTQDLSSLYLKKA